MKTGILLSVSKMSLSDLLHKLRKAFSLATYCPLDTWGHWLPVQCCIGNHGTGYVKPQTCFQYTKEETALVEISAVRHKFSRFTL